ncbi:MULTISPECIES: extracellular catalytic domain type 1 short-chain-length polyhydroxyalkanoate depolymerase [unclassified Psychrobacter]|uniref:extracellular catalytic domain type 1 short-chain-length polyhydroxyalkanoate depolymerase n=1 Tax=unclassified Psychrobacter TaxID=196806 RepID=UPI003F4721F0
MNFSKFNMTPPHLKEAMELMKSGQLKEATIAIQKNLSGAAPASHTDKNPIKDVTPIKDVAPDVTSDVPMSQDRTSPTDKPTGTDELFSKLPDKLQDFTDKMKHFKLDLPSVMDISALRTGVSTHSEPFIPDNAQFLKGNLKSSQGSHDYRLYIPSNYAQAVEDGLRLPLIVMLHGCTQSPEDFAVGTRMNELAEKHRCLIVYPSQPASANPNRCWNWFKPSDQQQGKGEPAWLAALTTSIIEDYAVDSSRVYIAGLSAGAAMAVIMAENYPKMYAAVGVHSGLAYRSATDLPSAMMTMRQGGSAPLKPASNNKFVPMIVFHGDQDHTVSIRNGEQVFEQAKQRLQAQETGLTTHQHKQCSEQNCRSTQLEIRDSKGVSQLEYWKIHGAGHSWAGGNSAGSYTDPKGPDASKEMLRFFFNQ